MTWVLFAQSNIWGSSTFDRFIHPQRGSKQLQLMLEAQGFQVSLGFISVTVAFLLGLAVRPLKGCPDGTTETAVTEDRRTHQRTGRALERAPHRPWRLSLAGKGRVAVQSLARSAPLCLVPAVHEALARVLGMWRPSRKTGSALKDGICVSVSLSVERGREGRPSDDEHIPCSQIVTAAKNKILCLRQSGEPTPALVLRLKDSLCRHHLH